MPAVRQRRRGAFGGRARGDGPGPARAVRAGVPGIAAGIPAHAGITASRVSPAAASAAGFPLAAVVGIPLGPAIVRLPRASACAATAAGLFVLGAAAGIHRPAASQPVVER